MKKRSRRRRRHRRNPESILSSMTPFLLGATGLVVLLYLAKRASGAPSQLPGP